MLRLEDRKIRNFAIYVVLLFVSISCVATQKDQSFVPNKTAQSYLLNIKTSIDKNNLKKADDLYLSMRDEYEDDAKVGDAMFVLIDAHMNAGEYLLSKFYADTYIEDYPNGKRLAKAAYLRVKSVFMRFKNSHSNDTLEKQLESDIKIFRENFSHSKYMSDIKKISKEFKAILIKRNEEIALSYEKLGKPKAAAYYREKNKNL